jgi:hypothetical protein
MRNQMRSLKLETYRLHKDDMANVQQHVLNDVAAAGSNGWQTFLAYQTAVNWTGKGFQLGMLRSNVSFKLLICKRKCIFSRDYDTAVADDTERIQPSRCLYR